MLIYVFIYSSTEQIHHNLGTIIFLDRILGTLLNEEWKAYSMNGESSSGGQRMRKKNIERSKNTLKK